MNQTRKMLFPWLTGIVIGVFILFFYLSQTVSANEETIRVGVFELNGFYYKDKDGNPQGYGVDYLNKIAEKTGWSYDYIWAENWNECVELLREQKVDIIAPTQKTPERMEEFDFSSFSIGMECGALLTLSTNQKLVYEDFESFNDIQIGCVDTLVFKDAFFQYAKSHGFKPHLVSFRDTKALMAALNAGEVDAALVNLFVKTDTTKVLSKFGMEPFYFMINKNHPVLLQKLNDSLQQIKIEFTEFETELIKKYYPSFSNTPFTKAELEYIEHAPVFKVAYRTHAKPLSYIEEKTNEAAGITRDILDEISRISGLQFEYVPIPEGKITYDYFWEQDISLISSVEYNKVNMASPGMKLTIPYLNSNKVFVCKKNSYFDRDQKIEVAIATGSQTISTVIQNTYPNFHVTIYNNIEECFEAVRKGKADFLLQNQYIVTSYLAKPLYSDMVTIPVEQLPDQMCLSPVINKEKGVKNSLLADERLLSILNKSIRQISESYINKCIIRQTTKNQYHYNYQDFLYQYRYPFLAIIVILLFLLIALSYIMKIKRNHIRIIKENEAKLRNITNNINGGVVVLTAEEELRIVYANEGFLKLLKYEDKEFLQIEQREYKTYVHPDDMDILQSILAMDIKKNNQISVKLRIMKKDGGFIPTLFNGTLTQNSKGEREIYCVIMDNSEQERLLKKVAFEQEKYSILIENSGDIIFEVDCKQNKLRLSPLFEQKFGWNLRKATLTCITEILYLIKIYEADLDEMERTFQRVFIEKTNQISQVRIKKVDGGYLWCKISQYPMIDLEGNVECIIGKILDIDKEIRTREELEQKSRLDGLTGLLNKAAFFEEARNYLKSANGKNTALIFLDVDNFKQINDNLGHMIGDQAIKETARRLQVIFTYDILARFGGDEFCILLKEIPENTLQDKLSWVVEKLKTVYRAEGKEVSSSASVGAACTYGEKIELEDFIEMADKALYHAKENGKNQFVLYYPDLNSSEMK